jgi:hypothetical protein
VDTSVFKARSGPPAAASRYDRQAMSVSWGEMVSP